MEANGTLRQVAGRRARMVCHRCHEKKIRCYLQRVGIACSNCLSAAASCDFRPSRKGHHRKKPGHVAPQSQDDATSSTLDISASSVPAVASNGVRYLRALLGHQSGHDGNRFRVVTAQSCVAEASDTFLPGIVRAYLETYSEGCYVWCPIIDIDDSTMTTGCLLLDHSLASLASRIKPSLMPGVSRSTEHYERARHLFYSERQHNALTLVKAALLLSHCDNSRLGSPMEGSFWWLGVAIRLVQDIQLHRARREAADAPNVGLQRRIWWTLFARERIMALCQGRPCTIDESDCNLGLPSMADFPIGHVREGRLFVLWVNLCRIMGTVNKHMQTARQTGLSIPTHEIAASLILWLQSVPADLQLPIQDAHSVPFVPDVHILYLPYLTTVAITYLNTSNQDVPEISAAAVLAAGCIARIIRDVLLRDVTHALPEDSGWYITIAIIALMHVRSVPSLKVHAVADILVLRTALGHLGRRWLSAEVPATGLDKIMGDHQSAVTVNGERADLAELPSTEISAASFVAKAQNLQDLRANDGMPWTDFFTFATAQTSPLVAAVLTECQDSYPESWPAFDFGVDFETSWRDLFADQTNFL